MRPPPGPALSLRDALVDAASALLPRCSPQDLSNLAWSLASLGPPSTIAARFMDDLLSAAQPLLPKFGPQELSSTAWALATLDPRRGGCSKRAGRALTEDDPGLDPATQLGEFMSALVSASEPLLPKFWPGELAHLAWATARLAQPLQPGFEAALLRAAQPQLARFKAPEAAHLLWALAERERAWHEGGGGGGGSGAFVEALLAALQPLLPRLQPPALSLVADALARLRSAGGAAGFLPSLAAAARAVLPSLRPAELSTTAWALATLGCSGSSGPAPDFPAALLSPALLLPLLPDFKPEELARTAWALAVFGSVAAEYGSTDPFWGPGSETGSGSGFVSVALALLDAAAERWANEGMDDESLCRVYTLQLLLADLGWAAHVRAGGGMAGLMEECGRAWAGRAEAAVDEAAALLRGRVQQACQGVGQGCKVRG